jgi:hypothetical protein
MSACETVLCDTTGCDRIGFGETTMPVTKEDPQAFHRFADEKLNRGEANSLVDLAGQWEAQRRETEETASDIRHSHADIHAATSKPLATPSPKLESAWDYRTPRGGYNGGRSTRY